MTTDDDFEFALPKGTLLANEYRIDMVLGAGGFGITYAAHDVKLEVDVAIKEYFPGTLANRHQTQAVSPRTRSDREQFEWGLERFLEEAKRLARLSHPNIVRCSRYFSENDTGYFVMTFEKGETLARHFKTPPQQEELDEVFAPLLGALEMLHANGLYHRDISPDNILIRADGSPVLLDFGASRQELATRSRTLAAIVKPGYSPIEQYDTATRQQGAWTDIYACGATLYTLVCGAPPPEAAARIQKDGYVPAVKAARGAYRTEFLDAIDWALMMHPDERPGSVREWRRKLLGAEKGAPRTAATRMADRPRTPLTAITKLATGDVSTLIAKAKEKAKEQGASTLALRIAAGVLALTVGLKQMFGPAAPPPPQPPPREVAVSLAAAEDEERKIAALGTDADNAWARVRSVLHSLGHLGSDTAASMADTRQALKAYQKAAGEEQTGYLTRRQFERIIEEQVELPLFNPPDSVVVGRWYKSFDTPPCAIMTAADRMEGRHIATARPLMEFQVPADKKTNLDVAFTWGALFDTSLPVTFVAGNDQAIMTYDGEQFLLPKKSNGDWSEAVTLALRLKKGEFFITGTSRYGGALKITFSSIGFEEAFRAMSTTCGEGLDVWIEAWGGVVVTDEDQFYWSTGIGSEQDAAAQAMAACQGDHPGDTCKAVTTFREQCFAMVRAKTRKGADTWSWAVRNTVDEAKAEAEKECAKQKWTDCSLSITDCADGSNSFNSQQ